MSGCQERLSSRGRWDITRYCGKPVVAEVEGTPVCKYHKTMADKRQAKWDEREAAERGAGERAQRISEALGIRVQVERDFNFRVTDRVLVSAVDLEDVAGKMRTDR